MSMWIHRMSFARSLGGEGLMPPSATESKCRALEESRRLGRVDFTIETVYGHCDAWAWCDVANPKRNDVDVNVVGDKLLSRLKTP